MTREFSNEQRQLLVSLYTIYKNEYGWYRRVCAKFNEKYPGVTPMGRSGIHKLNKKWNTKCSIATQRKGNCGPKPSVNTPENQEMYIYK